MDNKKIPVVVLDPGHGGNENAGGSSANNTSGGGLLEKDLTLAVARRTRERLRDRATVMLTRDSDTNLSLTDRAGFGRALGADVFVSLHCNGHVDPSHDSTEVYVRQDAPPGLRAFADSVRRAVAAAAGSLSGEVIEADLGVLVGDRHAEGTRALLVEMFDLTNPARWAAAADPAYLDRIAGALAESVLAQLGAGPVTMPTVGAAQAWRMPYSRSTAFVTPDIDWRVTGLGEAVGIWADWLARYSQWTVGVPDHSLAYFPHAAICQLKLTMSRISGPAYGTAFYIGDEVLLSCGHNFVHRRYGVASSVEVQPAYSPRMSVLPSATYAVNGWDVVHDKWWPSGPAPDPRFDLSVLKVPGLRASAGHFDLANMSLSQDAGIVVCGYGKLEGTDFEEQGQRMDGAHIESQDWDLLRYPIQTIGGNSGSPVFHDDMVVGVHTSGHGDHVNQGVLLTPEKNDWINLKAS